MDMWMISRKGCQVHFEVKVAAKFPKSQSWISSTRKEMADRSPTSSYSNSPEVKPPPPIVPKSDLFEIF